jgi:hypothetical protein
MRGNNRTIARGWQSNTYKMRPIRLTSSGKARGRWTLCFEIHPQKGVVFADALASHKVLAQYWQGLD